MDNEKFTGNINTEVALRLDFDIPMCNKCREVLIPCAYYEGNGWMLYFSCVNECDSHEEKQSNDILEQILWPSNDDVVYTDKELKSIGFDVVVV